ncbi:MAG: MGMT family protein [Promicromonosporaceae bacterium]|nr:MGMT family protein [Promicromonosporaceae bacterium]
MTYGLISEVLHDHLGYGGPRLVGNVMSGSGDRLGHLVPEGVDYPWWRVVNAAGAPPAPHAAEALAGLRAEATPLRRDGTRVRLKDAIWFPGADG